MTPVSAEVVQAAEAYLLFYERRQSDDHTRHRDLWLESGDTWADPARTLDVFFRLPDDVSLRYVRNRYLRQDDPRVKQEGLTAHLR